MADDDLPASQRPGTVHRQKARRAHTCAECPIPIQPGEIYIYLSTFDRGRWSRYVLCQKCERIRSCHRICELALDQDLPYSAGKLREEVRTFHKTIRNYQHAFLSAWEDSTPVEEKRA
jgi:hypothetical protein